MRFDAEVSHVWRRAPSGAKDLPVPPSMRIRVVMRRSFLVVVFDLFLEFFITGALLAFSLEFVASACQMIFSYPDFCLRSAIDFQLLVIAASRLSFAMGWLGSLALMSSKILTFRNFAASERERSRPMKICSLVSPSGRVTNTSCQVASVPFPVRNQTTSCFVWVAAVGP